MQYNKTTNILTIILTNLHEKFTKYVQVNKIKYETTKQTFAIKLTNENVK